MHPSEREIRAYQDGEANAQARQRLEAHLASCRRCQEKAQAMLARAQRIEDRLSGLRPTLGYSVLSIKAAQTRFEARLSRQQYPTAHEELYEEDEIASHNKLAMTFVSKEEKQSMWNRLTSRISRPAWAVMAIVAILGVSLAFPSVRAIANSFLQLFRVEQIRVVQVDTEKLPGQLEASSNLERILSENVQVEEQGESQEVASAAEASARAGFPVRMPAFLESPPKLLYQPGGSVTFQIDLELVRGVLKDIERSDIELPDSLDGAPVRMEFQGSVLASFGNCEFLTEATPGDPEDPDSPSEPTPYDCTTLMQATSPTISAPPELDIANLGEAYLQLLGMSQEEAASFARNVDWTTTFILPVPRYGADYQDVQVDGVTGILFRHWSYGEKQYTILWVKEGIVYALSSPGAMDDVLEIADSLK